MYKFEFFKLIREKLPKATLLFGENSFQIEEIINYFIKRSESENSVAKYYFDDYNFNSIKSYLSQSSLFGDTNFLVIKRDKKIPKLELETLIELTLKQQNSYFIFHFLGEYSDIKPHLNLFNRDGAVWVRFFKPDLNETILILEKKARELKVMINRDNILKLLNLLEGDLQLALNELEKFSILNREIKSKDIDNLVYSTTPLAVEKFLVKFFRKENITPTLKRLLEFGEDEFYIIRSTQNFINQITLFKLYININGRVDSREILGYRLPKNIERERVDISSRLSFETLSQLFEELIEIELQLKKRQTTTKEVLFYTSFIRLQRLI